MAFLIVINFPHKVLWYWPLDKVHKAFFISLQLICHLMKFIANNKIFVFLAKHVWSFLFAKYLFAEALRISVMHEMRLNHRYFCSLAFVQIFLLSNAKVAFHLICNQFISEWEHENLFTTQVLPSSARQNCNPGSVEPLSN